MQQKYEQLKAKLQAEGLFDQQFKQPLPTPAHCIGVITSKTGAALHDILHVLKRRDPSLPVIIYPTAVQGDDAPGQIVRAIELANARQECDVLIVGRASASPTAPANAATCLMPPCAATAAVTASACLSATAHCSTNPPPAPSAPTALAPRPACPGSDPFSQPKTEPLQNQALASGSEKRGSTGKIGQVL